MKFKIGDVVKLRDQHDNLFSLKAYLDSSDITLNELQGKFAEIFEIYDHDVTNNEIWVMFYHDKNNEHYCFMENELMFANTNDQINIYDVLKDMLNE